jgi:hypothetical protein
MTDEHHQSATGVGFERRDLRPATVFLFLVGLAVGCIVVTFAIWVAYSLTNSYVAARQTKNPLVQAEVDTRKVTASQINKFAQPRLEINERTEINQFRLHEEQQLNSYDWVDQPAGVVRIPIDRAMQLLAERGLPTSPKAGETPPSTIHTVNQAVQRVDTSNQTPQTKPRMPHGGKGQQ